MEKFEYRWDRMVAFFQWKNKDLSAITGLSVNHIVSYKTRKIQQKHKENAVIYFEQLTDKGTIMINNTSMKIPEPETKGFHNLIPAIQFVFTKSEKI